VEEQVGPAVAVDVGDRQRADLVVDRVRSAYKALALGQPIDVLKVVGRHRHRLVGAAPAEDADLALLVVDVDDLVGAVVVEIGEIEAGDAEAGLDELAGRRSRANRRLPRPAPPCT